MAKLAIFRSFDEIARPLEGARTQNHYRSISYDIWGHISISLFEIQKFLFFTPPYYASAHTKAMPFTEKVNISMLNSLCW